MIPFVMKNGKGRKRPPVNCTVSVTQALTPVLRTNIPLQVRAFTPLLRNKLNKNGFKYHFKNPLRSVVLSLHFLVLNPITNFHFFLILI